MRSLAAVILVLHLGAHVNFRVNFTLEKYEKSKTKKLYRVVATAQGCKPSSRAGPRGLCNTVLGRPPGTGMLATEL